jgi:hypothetical protein
MKNLDISVLPEPFAVCRLGPDGAVPDWLPRSRFWSVTRTDEELSIVLPEMQAPEGWETERGWRCLKVQGPLDLNLTGILARLSAPLAEAQISIFTISTFDTDHIFVRHQDLEKAREVLTAYGHNVSG